ncbi:MAG: zeta toxin family protein [Bacteroidetes bacterium]|nr:zeta toxin family protein [Bacteroidota bacterium]
MSKLYGDIQKKNNSTEKIRTLTFDQDILKSLSEIIEEYLGSSSLQQTPHALIVTGPMASGKTTTIKEKYISTHVYIDHDDILIKIRDKFSTYEVEKLEDFTMFCLNQIIDKSVSTKRNIVFESFGNNRERLYSIMNSLNRFGYKAESIIINCDINEGLRRQLDRTQTSEYYPTCYYSEELTLDSILSYVSVSGKN